MAISANGAFLDRVAGSRAGRFNGIGGILVLTLRRAFHFNLSATFADGKALVALKRRLNSEAGDKGIQFVTISRPVAFGEYAPYTLAEDVNEFVKLVQAMIEKEKQE